jgi:hypothetical protein
MLYLIEGDVGQVSAYRAYDGGTCYGALLALVVPEAVTR